ncbi:MAG: IclR family transcriptional regulator [Chitinophagales bacterium]
MIQSVDRALTILCFFDHHVQELGITEIGQLMNLSKSTVYGLVKTLEAKGFLVQNQENGKYRLGLKVYELGMAYSASVELKMAAKESAEMLSTKYQESVHVAILAGNTAVFVMRNEPRESIYTFPRLGASVPAYITAVGKVLMAYLPEDELAKHLSDNMVAYTRNTITDKEKFKEEMAVIKSRGYAIDREEAVSVISCIAAPIRDQSKRVVAAISLSGETDKILGPEKESIIKDIIGAAGQVSKLLGYTVKY